MQQALMLEDTQEQPKNIKSVWKEELSERLSHFCQVADNFNQALAQANKFLTSYVSDLSGYSTMNSVVKEWLEEVCEKANDDAQNISHVKITRDLLPSSIREFGFPSARGICGPDPEIEKDVSFYEAPNKLLADWIIKNFDFDKLESGLNRAKAQIQSLGFSKAADSLAYDFGLTGGGYYDSKELVMKKQKGRYLLETSHYGDWVYKRVESLNSLRSAVRTFELEAGVCGLSYCLQMCINEENSLGKNFDVWVPSRTKVAIKDSNVSATFFKDKIKFAFEPEVFEAMISFINEYKSEKTELKTVVVGK